MPRTEIDLSSLRARLAATGGGERFWRSLDALADTPEFRAYMEAEFPAAAVPPAGGGDRRRFLKLMAASMAFGGLAACDRFDGRTKIVPPVRDSSRIEPGASLSYASGTLLDGIANGILVTTRDGRPIKIEGNPQHPWSRGGTDIFGQAAVLGLYDPDRSQSVQFAGRPADWRALRAAIGGRMAALQAPDGRGLRILTGPLSAPAFIAQIAALRSRFPAMHWHTHSPIDREPLYAASRQVFGHRLETRWNFKEAAVVVALDGDFLDGGAHQVGVSRDWVAARQAVAANGHLLRLYAAAATPGLTSAKADDTLVADPLRLGALAEMLLAEIAGAPVAAEGDALSAWRRRAATELGANRGTSLVVAGMTQPAAVHEAVHRLNAALGNVGKTVFYTPPVLAEAESLADLTRAMHAGTVELLIMLDTNPVYSAPADLGFAAALARVGLSMQGGQHFDETAAAADWHAPIVHPLEAWGDGRSLDGTLTLMQPTIAPIYDGLSPPELLSRLADTAPRSGRAILEAYWQKTWPGGAHGAGFAEAWRTALGAGFIAGTAFAPTTVTPTTVTPAGKPAAKPAPAASGLHLLIRPDPTVWDGTLANNGWLQELPKPLTKAVWENVVAISPSLAERRHLATGDVVSLTAAGRTIAGPAWILPGQADDAVTVYLGYGRQAQGLICTGLGYDAYALRRSAQPWHLPGVTLKSTSRHEEIASTQDHGTMQGHDFVRRQPVGSAPVGDPNMERPTLYPKAPGDGRAWGMVIDLDSCIGCNACIVACQAENNSPVVGKEQVAEGRDMHWLRVDRYYTGALETPATYFMPVPCMQCEEAPCEVACPVEATVHDQEGLNLMVYNRCVGTRACSSYCPYKVRHFNFFDYSAATAPSLALQRNPEVSVRSGGVMEKCTYCLQRIVAARIEADRENRPIPDGAVKTACQGACPTRAITFGDLADGASAVSRARHDTRNYTLLGELNTRPRTTYLATLAPGPDDTGPDDTSPAKSGSREG